MKIVDSLRRTIAGKDYVLQSLNKELNKIQDEFRKKMRNAKKNIWLFERKMNKP